MMDINADLTMPVIVDTTEVHSVPEQDVLNTRPDMLPASERAIVYEAAAT